MAASKPDGPAIALAAAIQSSDVVAARAILARDPALRERLDKPLPGGAFGATALTLAVESSSVPMIDLLLGAGATIDAKTHWWAGGFTPLDVADRDVATALIERGAPLTLHVAARLGMGDAVERLLREDPGAVHGRGGDGQTPLHLAATEDIARLLLDHGADIDALDVDHESTPAMYHVRDRLDVTRYLMLRGCATDLLMACAVGDVALVRQYLDRRPDLVRMAVSESYFPKRDPRAGGTIYIWTLGGNKSPHAVAREFGHEDVFNLLMERTPDALAFALSAEIGDDARVAEALAARPDMAVTLGHAERLKLVAAAERNDTRVVRLMLSAGWPAAVRSGSEATALHWAGFHGNLEMMREILRHDPPVSATEATFGGTPLDWTLHGSLHGWHRASGDYAGCADALLDAGATLPATVNATDAVLARLQLRRTIQ